MSEGLVPAVSRPPRVPAGAKTRRRVESAEAEQRRSRGAGTESRPQEQPTRTGAPVPLPVAATVRRPDAGRPVGRGKRTGAGRSGEAGP